MSFNFMATVTICSDFGAPKIKSVTVSIVSSSIFHEVMGPDAMILLFWMLSFKPTFSLFFFTFIKRLFSPSSLSAIRVVSSACLRLLIFLPAILLPACASSSPAFLMMYSAYKLNSRVTIYSLDVFFPQFGVTLNTLWKEIVYKYRNNITDVTASLRDVHMLCCFII